MKIFDYDQQRVLLVAVAQFENEGFRKGVYVSKLTGFNQGRQKFCAKTRTLVADATDQIVEKILGSLSGASTLYQATRRPQRSAKSIANMLLPVPARPLIMVEAPAPRLCSSELSKRGRERRGRLPGFAILSVMSSNLLLSRS